MSVDTVVECDRLTAVRVPGSWSMGLQSPRRFKYLEKKQRRQLPGYKLIIEFIFGDAGNEEETSD